MKTSSWKPTSERRSSDLTLTSDIYIQRKAKEPAKLPLFLALYIVHLEILAGHDFEATDEVGTLVASVHNGELTASPEVQQALTALSHIVENIGTRVENEVLASLRADGRLID